MNEYMMTFHAGIGIKQCVSMFFDWCCVFCYRPGPLTASESPAPISHSLFTPVVNAVEVEWLKEDRRNTPGMSTPCLRWRDNGGQ